MKYPFALPEGPTVRELGRVKSKPACDRLAAKLLREGHKVVYAFAHVIVTRPGDWQYGYVLRDGIPRNGKLPEILYQASQNWDGGQAY